MTELIAALFSKELLTSFFGAFFAFRFNISQQRHKEKDDNIAYLKYSIVCVGKLLDTIHREKARRAKGGNAAKIFSSKSPSPNLTDLEICTAIDEASQHRYFGAEIPFIIAIEKLSFSVTDEPNLVNLIIFLKETIYQANDIMLSINNNIISLKSAEDDKMRERYLDSLINQMHALDDRLNWSFFYAEMSHQKLNLFGTIVFGKDFTGFRMQHSSDAQLFAPHAKEFEKSSFQTYPWFSQIKPSRWAKLYAAIKSKVCL